MSLGIRMFVPRDGRYRHDSGECNGGPGRRRRPPGTIGGMGFARVDRVAGPPVALLADGRPLVARCHVARRAVPRLVGLLGTPDLSPEEALWIEPCASVHALGLRARIGVAFVGPDGRVLRVVDPLRRGRAAGVRGARAAVECAAGVLGTVRPGTVLTLGPASVR
jgi:uncharacterized protein